MRQSWQELSAVSGLTVTAEAALPDRIRTLPGALRHGRPPKPEPEAETSRRVTAERRYGCAFKDPPCEAGFGAH